jgi:ubiquitin-conjugating enzyme E2 R
VSALFCRKQVSQTRSEAARDGVTVPTTLKDYCVAAKPARPSESAVDLDFYDDDYMEDDDDDDDDDEVYGNDEDSGNSDS